ncbi:MAG: hypothetical protein OWS74_05515 [Firmicutes bacterium]|nr:hypothetical protein [Bacillota bacterium]
MEQELKNEITEEELKQLIEKAKENEPERHYVLDIEDISDFSNKDWFTRSYEIIYGEVQEIITQEKEKCYGNIIVRNVTIIPKTKEVVIRIIENSDHDEWKQTYYYVFLSTKGWIKVK